MESLTGQCPAQSTSYRSWAWTALTAGLWALGCVIVAAGLYEGGQWDWEGALTVGICVVSFFRALAARMVVSPRGVTVVRMFWVRRVPADRIIGIVCRGYDGIYTRGSVSRIAVMVVIEMDNGSYAEVPHLSGSSAKMWRVADQAQACLGRERGAGPLRRTTRSTPLRRRSP